MKTIAEIKADLVALDLPVGQMIVAATPALEVLFVNSVFAEMLGFESCEVFLLARGSSAWSCVCPEDMPRLQQASASRPGRFEPYEIAYRALKKDGGYIWVNQNSRHALDENGKEIIFAYYTDITAQKLAEQALRESEFRYATAIKASNINIWEYHYDADTMTIFSTSPKVQVAPHTIPNYSKTVLAEGHLRPDSAPLFFGMLNDLRAGAAEVTADLWIRDRPDDEFWCERVVYTNLFDAYGAPEKAYCVGHDVTREKEAEKRYLDELSYRQAMQKATMASINVSLTKNSILDYKSIFPEVAAHMAAAKTVQSYFDRVYTEITTPEQRKRCAALFNRESLLRHFAGGETTLSLELTRQLAGRRYYTVLTAHMMKKAENNEVVAFLYSTDITGERTMQNVMNAIVKTDYDFLVVVDAQRNSAIRYSQNDLGNSYAQETENFETETQDYIREYVCPEDAQRVVAEITLKNLLTQLDNHGTYSVFYNTPYPGGGVCNKQLRFSYINPDQQLFLMTRIDITAAMREQDKKNQELLAAVEMAERANAAKSDFLSRISHEIRTPMNAIMGMDQLAIERLNDPPFLRECIEKSQDASQYLLQLLNDVLDMSKIESGRVTLKNEIIHCQRFLDAVATIIEAQASAKGVRYLVTQFDRCGECYEGDGVRLKQILINILTNAVKFTPPGGTVRLDISLIAADEKRANICFQISDTGIGISPAFLPKLFEPFSQEHSGSTSTYGGSGLGLAISKNLAQLMGGDIFVKSVLGKGTIFQVNICLGIPSPSALPQICASPEPQRNYDFTGKKILLVEDHQLNIMVAKKLLEFKNATVDVAENGQIALDLFAAAPCHSYDAVLMDIRMPVMDGLQAAAGIRGRDDPWAKVVPIIAMSANAFEDDVLKSKAAGMNAHLPKPIDAALLYHTLDQYFQTGDARDG